MSDAAPPAPPRVPRAFVLSLAALTALLLVLGILRSNRGTLRGDEVVALFWNREEGRLPSMVVLGARVQMSPAPLFYILDRIVDDRAEHVDYLGLTPSGYYRLPSLLYTAGLGAAAAWLLARRLARQERLASPVSYVLVLCGIGVYWFQPKMFAFACTDRPYALWNGLWLLLLALLLGRPESKIAIAVVLSLMATVATAACFQILAVALGGFVGRRLQGKRPMEILREAAPVLAVPALLGLYYALRSHPGPDEEILTSESVRGLLRFWLVTNLSAWLAVGFCGALLGLRPKLRDFAVPVGALVALLILVPLTYTLATLKGYSSPSRHYLWTTACIPFALFIAALALSEFESRPAVPRAAALAGIALLLGFSVVTFFRAPARNDSRRYACLDRGSPLEQLLQGERPVALAYPLDETEEIDRLNIRLLAEWIGSRYRRLPREERVAPLRIVGGELRSEALSNFGRLKGYGVVMVGD
jgi:hypothetical protein